MPKEHLLITETYKVATESIKEALNARNISFTFLPAFPFGDNDVTTEDDFWIKLSNITYGFKMDGFSSYELQKVYKRTYSNNIISFINDMMNETTHIFLAQDNDVGGNMMANVLYYKLIDSGIRKERLHRVIGMQLNEKENSVDIYPANFMERDRLFRLVDRYKKELIFINKARKINKDLGVGYRKLASLSLALKMQYEEIEIIKLNNNIALPTYIVNYIFKKQEEV